LANMVRITTTEAFDDWARKTRRLNLFSMLQKLIGSRGSVMLRKCRCHNWPIVISKKAAVDFMRCEDEANVPDLTS
jgi:hypothetical protein